MQGEFRVEITEDAAADIFLQADWYDQRAGLEVAERYLMAMASAQKRLRENPETGRFRRFRSRHLYNVRSLAVDKPFHNHLIFYRREGEIILVLRVMHGVRDLPRRLMEPPGSD